MSYIIFYLSFLSGKNLDCLHIFSDINCTGVNILCLIFFYVFWFLMSFMKFLIGMKSMYLFKVIKVHCEMLLWKAVSISFPEALQKSNLFIILSRIEYYCSFKICHLDRWKWNINKCLRNFIYICNFLLSASIITHKWEPTLSIFIYNKFHVYLFLKF